MAAYYEPGTYYGKVLSQALGESKVQKTPQFALTFQVVGRINPEEPDGDLIACTQYERTVFFYLTEKSMEYVIRDLERLGFQGSSFGDLDPSAGNSFQDFTGKEFTFYCDHEEYKGAYQEKWSLAREGGMQIAPLPREGIRKLDALFGAQLKKLSKQNGRRPAPPPSIPMQPAETHATVMAGPPPGDDIPF